VCFLSAQETQLCDVVTMSESVRTPLQKSSRAYGLTKNFTPSYISNSVGLVSAAFARSASQIDFELISNRFEMKPKPNQIN